MEMPFKKFFKISASFQRQEARLIVYTYDSFRDLRLSILSLTEYLY
jgi:hypothetical protein